MVERGGLSPAPRRAFPCPFPVSRALAGGHRGHSEPSRWRFPAEFPRKCGNISTHIWKLHGKCLYSRRSQSIFTKKWTERFPRVSIIRVMAAMPSGWHGRLCFKVVKPYHSQGQDINAYIARKVSVYQGRPCREARAVSLATPGPRGDAAAWNRLTGRRRAGGLPTGWPRTGPRPWDGAKA